MAVAVVGVIFFYLGMSPSPLFTYLALRRHSLLTRLFPIA